MNYCPENLIFAKALAILAFARFYVSRTVFTIRLICVLFATAVAENGSGF